ncbi:hypothetical protein MMC28_004101 [Mycoblastus sanguinarius]|nr:hypothetical protein [Mycoblastus sanguinarius]
MSLKFKGKYMRRADMTALETFVDALPPSSRVRQFARGETSDLTNTVCTVVKGWHDNRHGGPWHFTCHLEYDGWFYKSGYAPVWARIKYGSVHVKEDGRESRRGKRMW